MIPVRTKASKFCMNKYLFNVLPNPKLSPSELMIGTNCSLTCRQRNSKSTLPESKSPQPLPNIITHPQGKFAKSTSTSQSSKNQSKFAIGITHKNIFPFMKREHPSSSASMTLQNSYDSDRDTVSAAVLLLQEFKKANHETVSCDEQIKSVKPRWDSWETNGEFKRHQPRLLSKSTVKEANHQSEDDGAAKLQPSSAVLTPLVENLRTTKEAEASTVDTGQERLKGHRIEVAGRVWIPDIWGQEELLKDWIDCSAFDASIMNSSIMSARAALVEEGRRANSSRIRIENSC